MVSGDIRPADIAGLAGERFAVWAHNSESLVCRDRDEAWQIALPLRGFEVYTMAPIVNGFAPIGLVDKYNSAGAITACERDPQGTQVIALRDGGQFVAWSARKPRQILLGDTAVAFCYDESSGKVSVEVPCEGSATLRISW